MNLEEYLADVTFEAGVEQEKLMLSRASKEGGLLTYFKKGVKNYHSFACNQCKKISFISEYEEENFIENVMHTYDKRKVTCPNCKKESYVTLSRQFGFVKAYTDGSNFVDVLCDNSMYPDVKIIKACKLEELSYKNIYEHVEQTPKRNSWLVESMKDETAWGYLYQKLKETDINGKIDDFVDDLY